VFFVGNNGQFCLAGNGSIQGSSTLIADCAVEETQQKTFTSTMDAMKKIARNEGYQTLWRGMSPTLMMAIPGNVIYFTGYDWLRYNHASPIRKIASDTYAPLIAGSVARVAAGIAVSPVEMFRTRMQATAGSGSGVFKETLLGLHRMAQTQGYTSLWRGLTLTLWRDVPFSGFYWWGYEAIRNKLTDAREVARGRHLDPGRSLTSGRAAQAEQDHTTTFVDSFIAGSGSGAIAAFITTPFDVGKTRQQVYHHAGDDAPSVVSAREAAKAGKHIPEELHITQFLRHIYAEEGIAGLFKGWAARCMKVAPACAIMISSYELGKKWAKTQNEKKEEDKALA
jgi:solute carrier family 25 protein 39/40